MEEKSICGMIMAVLLDKRVESATEVQRTLTEHGCIIRMRLGLHEASKDYCTEDGLILLHTIGTVEEAQALEAALVAIPGVRVKSMGLNEAH